MYSKRGELVYQQQVRHRVKSFSFQSIEKVQRRFTKSILSDFNLSYKERLLSLGMLPLSYRREITDLSFLFKCIHGVYDVDVSRFNITRATNTINLRSAESGPLFRHGMCRTVTFQSSFYNRTLDVWNTLPGNIRNCTTPASFKRSLKLHYYNKLACTFDPDNTCSWVSVCRCSMCQQPVSVLLSSAWNTIRF